MANASIPRATVHAWSEEIGDNAIAHQTALTRLLKEQRRLTRFIEENAANLQGASGGVTVYLIGVILRMFDMAGGRLKGATWAQLREASVRVQSVAGDLLPIDDGLGERFRAVSWRAQPHILDEAYMALFEATRSEEEENLSQEEAFKILLLLWVVTEVLDGNWRPAPGFAGDTEYVYTHVEPS